MKSISSTSVVASLALLLAMLAPSTTAVGYGEKCDINTGPSCDAAYTCRYGVCACSNMEYNFDVAQGRCVGVVRSSCGSDSDCGGMMECRDLFCSCIEGYSPTRDFQCKKGMDAVCTNANDCNQDARLVCPSERKCRCDDSTHVYDSATLLCRAKVGHTCDPYTDMNGFPNGETGHRCVSDAVCQRNAETKAHECKCGEGFEVTEAKECKAIEGDGDSGASGVSAGVAFIVSFAVLAIRA